MLPDRLIWKVTFAICPVFAILTFSHVWALPIWLVY